MKRNKIINKILIHFIISKINGFAAVCVQIAHLHVDCVPFLVKCCTAAHVQCSCNIYNRYLSFEIRMHSIQFDTLDYINTVQIFGHLKSIICMPFIL